MSGHKKSFYKTLRLPEEKAIFWIAILGIIAYFIWQLIAVGSDLGLFSKTLFSSRFWELLGQTILIAWEARLGPVFIVLDILLVIIFIFAVVGYLPIAQRV